MSNNMFKHLDVDLVMETSKEDCNLIVNNLKEVLGILAKNLKVKLS